ncbi:H/ACA ribonucleoprotein complex non-core subunit NAF1 [Brienomyrus brachyistius]|uniref:H/ACA ribonucleoprotein complex non-core subunit NAF1 n=1 Tax=Brienomyrus brachyistius TaxID=42636 RepID=UPI0020B418B8|nr:H/ACA ribonucleoprotein complex non-core subunit NAF1 [Brienomyrus brachyistius]
MEEQPDVGIECPAEQPVGDAAGDVEENIAAVTANPSSALSEPACINDSSCNPLDAVTAGSDETKMDSEGQSSITVDASAERHLSEMTGDPESMTDGPGGIVESERSGSGYGVQHEDMDVSVSCKMETLNFTSSPGPTEVNGDCVRLPLTSGALLLSRDPGAKQSASGDSDESSTSEDSSSDSDSDSSSSSSSSSSSLGILEQPEDDDDFVGVNNGKRPLPIKTQDEILIENLPTVQDIGVILPEDTEIQPIGVISSIVEQLVIIESLKDTPPLNDDSVIFDKVRRSVGKVFEIFGPVSRPYYLLRFNSADHISEKDLNLNDTMYFAPSLKDFTDYIFTEQLKVFKGSDASWKNDQEPPPEALDFSDDEEEKMAKQKKKKKNIQQKPPTSDPCDADESLGQALQHRQPRPAGGGYRGRGVNPHPEGGFPSWRLPQRGAAARPCFYPPDGRMMGPPPDSHKLAAMGFPCLFPPPFQPPPPYFLPFPPPPPPHMPMPWPGQEMGPPPPLHGLPFQHFPPPPPPPPPPSS